MSFRTPRPDGLALPPNATADANNPAASSIELQGHAFWGRWAAPTELPNGVANPAGDPAYSLLRPGDRAWVQSAGMLYVLVDRGTLGGGDGRWEVAPQPVAGQADYYVAPSNGAASDANPGTLAAPLATLDEALRRVTPICRYNLEPVYVHLESGTYAWTVTLENLPLGAGAPLTIVCDGAGQPGDDGFVETIAPSAAAAGSTANVAVYGAGGLGVNALRGLTIEVLSGASIGHRRFINSNTATDIIPDYPLPGFAPGDSFRILETNCRITTPAPEPYANMGHSPPIVSGVGTPSRVPVGDTSLERAPNRSTLLLVNLGFVNPGFTAGFFPDLMIEESAVSLAGCVVYGTAAANSTVYRLRSDESSQVLAGIDVAYRLLDQGAFVLPAELGLTAAVPNPQLAWVGWGLSIRSGATSLTSASMLFQQFAGFVVWTTAQTNVVPIDSVRWVIYGGALIHTVNANQNGAFAFRGSVVLLTALGGLAGAAIPIRVQGQASGTTSATIRALGGSRITLSNVVVALTTNGVAVVAHGDEAGVNASLEAGLVSLISGVVFEIDAAVRGCVVAMTGGRIYWDAPPTVSGGPPTIAEAYLTQSSTGAAAVAGTGSTFAAVADGVVVSNADRSGSLYGRIT